MSEKDESSRMGRGQHERNRRAEKLEKMRKKEELRLKYLENRTPFKTGWEIEETEEEKERKKLGLKEVRLVHVPKMDPYTDEQIAKMTDYERREFEWKKTQRRVTEDYYHIAKDEIMRHCKPQRKLRPVGSCFSQEYRGPIVSLEAPVPYFSTDGVKDSGVRKELDLMCLEDRLYMEALICDIKGIENRHSFTLGPSASKWAKDYCLMRKNPNSTDRYPDKNVKCDRASTTTDPFGRAQVYYPDGYNYKGEEEAFRNRIQQATTNAIASRFLHLRDTTSNFMCSLTAGLQPTINLRDDENSFSRIFCIPTMDLSNLIFGLKGFVTFLGVREITAREKAYAAWKSDELGIAKSLLATEDTAYEVVFGSSQDGLNLCQKFGGRPDLFKAILKYPIGLDDCTVPTKPAFHSLVLKWYPYASEQKIDIFLKNAEDVGYAEQVFSGHGIPAYIPDHWKYLKGNTRMEAGYQNSYSNMSYDSVVAERVIKEVLGANQIEVDRVLLRRRNIRPHTDGHITNLIHQRIGRAAINAHVWSHAYVPGVDAEWFKFTNENKYHLGWQLELPPDQAPGTNDYERKATVTFDHDDFGLTVSTYLDERAPDKDIFSLAARDAQGVRFYPIYTTKFECPRPVRAVCDAALNAIDNEAREQSDYSKRTWVRLRDYKREDVLVVEGWPKEYIAETVEKVRAVLRGRVVACQDDGMERLLYGCGLQHVNQLQKTHEMVFMAVDRLNQEITMWGDEDAMDIVCVELDSYVKNRGAYMVNASIIIDTPRFLPIFSEILVFNTNERIGEAVGGAIARFRHPNRLEFMGSVIQYEEFQQLLDDTHAKILNVVKNMANCDDVSEFFQPADCPVCLCPTVGTYILELCGHHYCLQCLAQKIRVAIRERELPIRCCQEQCNEVIALGDILGLLLDENSLKYPQFWMDRLQTILKSCSETAVLNRRDVRFCTRPGCSAIIRLKVKGKRPEFYDCPRCQMQMCAGCWNPPHDGRSCDVEAALRGSVDLSLQEWSSGRQNEVKHCPTDNCRAVIQKEQGCNHMQCKMCKIHFCWLCSFTAETDRAIYSHMGERHGGTGGEWAFLDQQQANQVLGAPPGLEHMAMVNDQGGGVVMIDGEPVWVD